MSTQNTVEIKRGRLSRSLALVLIVLGITTIAAPALLAPFRAKTFSILLIGYVAVFAAIEQVAFATQSRDTGGISFRVLIAALYAVVGVALVRMPARGILSLLPIVGALFILDGIVEIVLAARLHLQSRGQAWLSASGVLSLSLGTLVFASGIIFLFLRSFPPSGSAWIVSMCVGVRLVFKGIEQIVERPVTITTASNQRENGLRPAA